eukprot:7375910-Prymnesium_polylepis.2
MAHRGAQKLYCRLEGKVERPTTLAGMRIRSPAPPPSESPLPWAWLEAPEMRRRAAKRRIDSLCGRSCTRCEGRG